MDEWHGKISTQQKPDTWERFEYHNSEQDVSHLYRWRVPCLLTGGEQISPASLKRQEEVLPAAKLEQRRYNKVEGYEIATFDKKLLRLLEA